MNNTRTLAFQISEELFLRIKVFLEAEQNRTGRKISQKEFVVGLIVNDTLIVNHSDTEKVYH